MTEQTRKSIVAIERYALKQLTDKGREEVRKYAIKVWNDNKLTRAHIMSIAARLLLTE